MSSRQLTPTKTDSCKEISCMKRFMYEVIHVFPV